MHERFVGYCEGVFVSADFAAWAKTGLAPYMNLHIAASTHAGKSPLLDLDRIRSENSGSGLHLYIAYTGWCEPPLTVEEAYLVRTYMNQEFAKLAQGYNFREVLIEVVGDESLRRAISAGFYLRTDFAAHFETAPPPSHLHPYLLSVTREEAMRVDGSLLAHTFAYSPPRFFFSLRDQELLLYAMTGSSDEEIAALLQRTPGNVKARWRTLYARVGDVMPHLLPAGVEGVRGREKRHLLLAYLRDHPEELRPLKPRRRQR